jgi:ABC-type Zn uptake system ZnuABC Zn-binding protein ZnuA
VSRLAEDSGRRLVRLHIDALSAADGPAATYEDLMRYNVRSIVEGLAGEMP